MLGFKSWFHLQGFRSPANTDPVRQQLVSLPPTWKTGTEFQALVLQAFGKYMRGSSFLPFR